MQHVNPETTTNVNDMFQFADSNNIQDRIALANNPNITDVIYGMLLNDPSDDVKIEVLKQEKKFPKVRIHKERWKGFDAIRKHVSNPNYGTMAGILRNELKLNDDIIVVTKYDATVKKFLTEQGFFEVPSRVTWTRPVQDIETYIKSIKKGRDIRRALNSLQEGKRNEDLELYWDRDMQDQDLYKSWYRDVYEKTLTSKPRGRPSDKLSGIFPPKKHTGFYIKKDDKLLGGRLLKDLGDRYSASYSAFTRDSKYLDELAYAKMMIEAKEKGKSKINLGIDTNFYGYHLSPGIYKSKSLYGFTPKPYESAGRGCSNVTIPKEMIKILRYEKFDDPFMFLSYGGDGLVNNIFIRNVQINPSDYEAPGGVKVWRV